MVDRSTLHRVLLAAGLLATVPAVAAGAALRVGTADPTTTAARDTEPVVLTGARLGDWAAPADATFKAPLTDLPNCATTNFDTCPHNRYAEPEVDSQRVVRQSGTPADRILGYRWDLQTRRFVQIPLQIDEVFTRYLENSASGFGFYSGDDPQTSVQFDREGFRYTKSDPRDPCRAVPDSPVATDPVAGLDTDDEVSFMASDAGPPAPADASAPNGIDGVRTVTLTDPLDPGAQPRVVYVMRAAAKGPKPAFDAGNGYVRYERDDNADTFVLDTANSYGNYAQGPYCTEDGDVVVDQKTGRPAIGRRQPLDRATVTTARYRFRYDARWVMSEIAISPDGKTYGPDLVDRWKGRAYAQDPTSKVPCCGYEDEQGNWSQSSTLLGERWGPVRVIRETWGSDSGTNTVRREVFYRDEMRLQTFLRVHPLPPLGGVYAQWDFNAGRVTRFYNPSLPDGVPVDGRNDEALGTLDDPCNPRYDQAGRYTAPDQAYRDAVKASPFCAVSPYHFSTDAPDPTTSQIGLPWTEVAGPWGSIVDRYQYQVEQTTPGGTPQSFLVLPYYRDDSCFDDGTGADPGIRVRPRSANEPTTTAAGAPRRCWKPADDIPVPGTDQFFQGDIGTHGVNVVMVAEADNARTTAPLTEIRGEQRMVMLPGYAGNVGERYGRGFEKPLVTAVR